MKRTRIPSIITFIVAIVTIAAFFLPMVSMTKEYEAQVDQATELAAELNVETPEIAGMTVNDMKDLSLFKFTNASLSGEGLSGSADSDKTVAGIFAAVGVMSVLIAIMAICKRPILMLLFDLILGGAYALVSVAMGQAFKVGVEYNWGIAHTLYIPLIAVIAVGAIWMFIAKRADKKARRLAGNR